MHSAAGKLKKAVVWAALCDITVWEKRVFAFLGSAAGKLKKAVVWAALWYYNISDSLKL